MPNEQRKSVVVKYKRGDAIVENGEPKLDAQGKPTYVQVPARTVTIKNMTAREAMDADDFALAISPTGEPSRDNRIRAFALCSVRAIDDEVILRPETLQDFEELLNRFTTDELFLLGRGHIAWSAELNEQSDSKNSPSEASSPQ